MDLRPSRRQRPDHRARIVLRVPSAVRRANAATHLPLLASQLVAASAAVAAISFTVNEPAYELAIHVLVVAGILASLLGLRLGRSFTPVGATLMVLVFVLYAVRFNPLVAPARLAYPTEILGDEELGLAALFAWFLAGFCFMQSQRENMVFTFAFGLTIFGLVATRNLNPELLGAFLVFLLASLYGWGYDHFLEVAGNLPAARDWRRWARNHLAGAVLIFALAAGGGSLLGNALFYTTPRFYAGFGLQQRIWNWAGAHVQGYFLLMQSFDIGTGPIHLSTDPIIKVKADEASLWRGRSYDYYDGHGWSRTLQSAHRVVRVADRTYDLRQARVERPAPNMMPPYAASQGNPLRRREFGGGRPPGNMPPSAGPGSPPPGMPPGGQFVYPTPEQQADMAGRWRAAAEATRGRRQDPRLNQPSPALPRADDRVALQQPAAEPPQGPVMRQEVEILTAPTSAVMTAPYPIKLRIGPAVGPLDIASAVGVSVDAYGSVQTGSIMQVGQTYTVWSRLPKFDPARLRATPSGPWDVDLSTRNIGQMSLEVESALADLVRRLTAPAGNDYDRAVAIQRYLEGTCLYTLDVPRTPAGLDPVVYFVRYSRRGACDLFASAMTLMCRLAGIPARVATGFAAGTYDPAEKAFVVRGTDAHAWSEVYFKGLGWVPFDLAATRSLERQSLVSLVNLGQWRLVVTQVGRLLLLSLLALLAVYLAATALVDPRPFVRALAGRWRPTTARERAAEEALRLLRSLAKRGGFRYQSAMTPAECLDRVAQSPAGPVLAPALPGIRQVLSQFYALRFGRTPATAQRPDPAQGVARALREIRRQIARRGRAPSTA
jgi:transglutaminase-like putative cysteine protease